jgi:hypothetical protein
VAAPCEPPCANGPQKAPPSRCASALLPALSSTRKASRNKTARRRVFRLLLLLISLVLPEVGVSLEATFAAAVRGSPEVGVSRPAVASEARPFCGPPGIR